MQNYKELVEDYIGASCEVLKLDNKLLFAGAIRAYNDADEELTVSLRKGMETPQGIIYTPRSNSMFKPSSPAGMYFCYMVLSPGVPPIFGKSHSSTRFPVPNGAAASVSPLRCPL